MPAPRPAFALSGVILAGGNSSRMGRDKAFLPFPAPDGPPLLAHQAALLRSLGIDDLLVSGRSGVDYSSVMPDARIVLDTVSDAGPIAGITAALRVARHPWLVVVAIDIPFLTTDYLRKLIALSEGSIGTVPHGTRGFEPLVALYPKTLVPILESSIQQGRFSLQRLLVKLAEDNIIKPVKIDHPEASIFINCNSPADLGRPPRSVS